MEIFKNKDLDKLTNSNKNNISAQSVENNIILIDIQKHQKDQSFTNKKCLLCSSDIFISLEIYQIPTLSTDSDNEISIMNDEVEINNLEKSYISCYNCRKFFHYACLMRNKYQINSSSICSWVKRLYFNSIFYCPLCIIKRLFPLTNILSEDFIQGPSFLNKSQVIENSPHFISGNKKTKNTDKTLNTPNNGFHQIKIPNGELNKLSNDSNTKLGIYIIDLASLYCINYVNYSKLNDLLDTNSSNEKNKIRASFFIGDVFIKNYSLDIFKMMDFTDDYRKYLQTQAFNIKFDLSANNINKNNLAFFICFYRKRDVEELNHVQELRILEHNQLPVALKELKEIEINKILKSLNTEKDELVYSKLEEKICFKCPYLNTLLNIPVKGRFCEHLKCFELKNFLKLFSKNYLKAKCPHCRKFIFIEDLVYGYYIGDKLTKFKKIYNNDAKIINIEEIVDLFNIQFEEANIGFNLEVERWEDALENGNMNIKKFTTKVDLEREEDYFCGLEGENEDINVLNNELNINEVLGDRLIHKKINSQKDLSNSINNEDDLNEQILDINIINSGNIGIIDTENNDSNLSMNFNFNFIQNKKCDNNSNANTFIKIENNDGLIEPRYDLRQRKLSNVNNNKGTSISCINNLLSIDIKIEKNNGNGKSSFLNLLTYNLIYLLYIFY